MKTFMIYIVLFLGFTHISTGQSLKSAAAFLGYELGQKFTFHHRVVDYFEHVAAHSSKVTLQTYGQSIEGRPLIVAFVSSPSNLQNLENFRKNNLINAGFESGTARGKQIPFVWMSYNVHGDEAAATEAALATLEALTKSDPKIEAWLNDLIVILDPCLNPDGRDRYAMWYNQTGNLPPNNSPNAYEHQQPWPGGRYNHYLFDLNRDWAWQVQHETKARIKLYHQYMPHVHVDFHEMGYQKPYFFAPAAKPYHEEITDWQSEFQVHVGNHHAKYFDAEGWTYYSKEVFDLLYPSYGDTWPIFQGAIGFTYEKGGSGKAGLVVKQETGLILTLAERVAQHLTTGLSTIETAHKHQTRLIKEFNKYFKKAPNANRKYQSFVIKHSNEKRKQQALMRLLDGQMIQYRLPTKAGGRYWGFDYLENKRDSFALEANDIVISTQQPQARLLNVLLEPKTKLEDSLTYDLTAWALPYVYGIEAYAVRERIEVGDQRPTLTPPTNIISTKKKNYGYVFQWKDIEDARFLAALLKNKIKARYAEKAFAMNGVNYQPGTIIILRADNKDVLDGYEKQVETLAQTLNYTYLTPIQGGLVSSGSDLGSNSMHYIKPPKVAVIAGNGVTATSFGALWHYFEQDLQYPLTVLHTNYLKSVTLTDYDVLILTPGYYRQLKMTGSFLSFVQQGGKIIAIGSAMNTFSTERKTQLGKATSAKNNRMESRPADKKYGHRQRSRLMYQTAGSIYKVYLDNTHPLAFGQSDFTHILKKNSRAYPTLNTAWNVGVFKEDSHVSGFVGSKLKAQLSESLALGVERLGRGQLIYFCDSPIFRGFWHSGQLFLGNAVFFVGN